MHIENRISKDLKFSEKYQSQDIESFLLKKKCKNQSKARNDQTRYQRYGRESAYEGKAKKGAGRMPWHQEPKKDVISCEKPWGGAHIPRSTDV